MGWLGDRLRNLLKAEQYHEVEVPPIRVWPLDPVQLLDLRALGDPGEALGVGMRVAVEMTYTIALAEQRVFVFSPAATHALIDLDAARLKQLRRSMCEHLPAGAEIGILVPPDQVERAAPAFGAAKLLAVPRTGPGSNGILDKIGAPIDKGFRVPLPTFAPDLHSIGELQGVGIRWQDDLLLDLRRTCSQLDTALATPFLCAKSVIAHLPAVKRRTWIIATWQLGRNPADALTRATPFAREAIAIRPPTERDQVAFDGDPPAELRRWVADLGLTVLDTPYRLTSSLSISYPELAQNFMIDYAVRGR